MISRLHLLSSLAFVAVLGGCSQEVILPQPLLATSSAADVPIGTGASTYTLERTSTGWEGRITYVFTNRTDRMISLLNCLGGYGIRLEKWQVDRWVGAWWPVRLECLSPPMEIAPGASLADELEIVIGRSGSNYYPQFAVPEIEGTYRLVIENAFWNYDHGGPPWGDPVPLERRVSNPFEIGTE